MDKAAYVDKAKTILLDANNYESINKNPVPEIEARTNRTLLSTIRGKLPEKNDE